MKIFNRKKQEKQTSILDIIRLILGENISEYAGDKKYSMHDEEIYTNGVNLDIKLFVNKEPFKEPLTCRGYKSDITTSIYIERAEKNKECFDMYTSLPYQESRIVKQFAKHYLKSLDESLFEPTKDRENTLISDNRIYLWYVKLTELKKTIEVIKDFHLKLYKALDKNKPIGKIVKEEQRLQRKFKKKNKEIGKVESKLKTEYEINLENLCKKTESVLNSQGKNE
jgi:hypothetical protein